MVVGGLTNIPIWDILKEKISRLSGQGQPMEKTIYSQQYQRLCDLLIEARKKAGLTQVEVAERLGKPQSFVAKYEGGERRLDVVEFIAVAKALELDAKVLIDRLMRD
ncbi:helix-turn-helix domain-containing protein [Microvirga calopogonii]|uniref:helix-turn-helix domain-containing protein n=1 Tax=Microvirga calopogonii TaxID=2078013 RepID=UPI001FDF56EE|nr:helix-turn-helix transcriptional regulator [Microvirga calopogonii]